MLTRRVASENLFYCIDRSGRNTCLKRVSVQDSSIVLDTRSADCLIRLWSRELARVEPARDDPRTIVLDGATELFSQRQRDGHIKVGQMPVHWLGRRMKMLSDLVLKLSDACLLGGSQGQRAAQKAVANVSEFCR